jgi:MFS transporter, PPP family, 3-phenylpropionic acid transporter
MHTALRLGFFYAAILFAAGVQLPFWPIWLSTRGLTASDIGALLAVGQWIKVATNPLAGVAADRGAPRRVMLLLSLAAVAGFVLFVPARGFAGLLLLGALTSASLSALLPLGDRLALAAASAGTLDYGRVRLWGSLSFIVATLLTGRLVGSGGDDSVLYLLIAATAVIVAASAVLPGGEVGSRSHPRTSWRLLTRPTLLLFLLAAALIQGSHAVYYGFGTIYWRGLGLSDGVIAALWAEGVVAEILLFYWGARFLGRFGSLGLLALGGGAGLVRWLAAAVATGVPVLVLLQLLHALTFGAAHLGAMHHLARRLPADQAATGLALYSAIVGGIGQGLILLLAGSLYGRTGGLAYVAMAALAALGTVIAAALSATKS